MTDPIADMLTRIRNAVHSKQTRVDMPASKLKAEIARILQDEGYIHGFKMVEEPVVRGGPPTPMIQRISRPGRRVYFGRADVPRVLGGLGTSILTTSRGVMSGREAARAGVGGEVLCNVW
jgi:small subunit ribosomal protein S8